MKIEINEIQKQYLIRSLKMLNFVTSDLKKSRIYHEITPDADERCDEDGKIINELLDLLLEEKQ